MANDNETVDQVCESVEYLCGTDGGRLEIFGEHINPISLADRILAAHNREMNALAKQKTAEAHEAFVKNAELAEAIAAKDAEIDDLKKENARLRVINCGSIYADGNLREEIEKLRALVGELADALYDFRDAPCDSCMLNRCPGIEKCKETKGTVLLVAKAKEVLNG